jgi:hypothetical protein
MFKLYAIMYFLLAFTGCSHDERSFVTRSTVNGVDQIYSKVRVHAGTGTFECLNSITGSCHFTLFACAVGQCDNAPTRQLAVAAGAELDVRNLPGQFQLCASVDDKPLTITCARPQKAS